jgi:adenylate kinase
MKVIVLLGAPGSGKGTAAEGIKAQTAYAHVSTGDILREAVKQGTPVGKQAEAFMKRGELVPDAIMMQVVEDRLAQGSADGCYMFDGFPRTREQAELLAGILAKRKSAVNFVFFLDVPREVLVSRLAGRRVCRSCGAVFHVVNIPPKKAGVCDACGGELYQRSDDMESTVANRLDVFRRQTEALIAYYKEQGILVCLDGAAQPRQKTVAEIVRRLNAAERS